MVRPGFAHAVAWLPLIGSLVRADDDDDIVYVTDLAIYTELASCVQGVLRMDVMGLTSSSNSQCAEGGATGLQSCVCSDASVSSSVASQLSSDVLSSCASTASDDVSSALTVLDAYCQQAATASSSSVYTFPQPSVAVTQLVGDIAEMQYLAPCASSQLYYAIMDMTDELCPTDAARLASCVCTKNQYQNAARVSSTLDVMVGNACSSQTADVASAQAMYAAYCQLGNGTSSFPSASSPPGDMSYYITDIPAFTSLAACGQSALSNAVFTQTYELCPEGPQLLASCACIKPGMSSIVDHYIKSLMSWSCSLSQVTPAASSAALSVFGMYCSAARDDMTLAGITRSVSQTAPIASGSAAMAAATATGSKATGTANGSSSATTGTGSSAGSSSSSSSPSSSNTGVIVGAVVGGIGGLVLLALAAFLVWRHKRQAKRSETNFDQLDSLSSPIGGDGDYGGKSELAGMPIFEAGGNPLPPPPPQQTYAELPALPTVHQADSTPIEAANVEVATPVRAGGHSYQSGPVPVVYSELDGTDAR